MNLLLVNPPYLSLTSAHGVCHQMPLGLLCIGGPLIDAGHTVRLLDAERHHLNVAGSPALEQGHAGRTGASSIRE